MNPVYFVFPVPRDGEEEIPSWNPEVRVETSETVGGAQGSMWNQHQGARTTTERETYVYFIIIIIIILNRIEYTLFILPEWDSKVPLISP
jgi:hypothetical protein